MSVLRNQKCTKHTALWDHCMESEKENKLEKETEKEPPPRTTPETLFVFLFQSTASLRIMQLVAHLRKCDVKVG